MAEAREVAVVPASLGARRRFERGILAKAVDQVGRVRKGDPAVDEGSVHAPDYTGVPFPECRQSS